MNRKRTRKGTGSPAAPPVRRAPVQNRSRETVRAVIQAAAEVLLAEGYERTTTNRIAERAGISIGSLYHYFPNKESVIAAMTDHAISATTGYFVLHGAPLLSGASLEKTVHGLVETAVAAIEHNRVYARAILTGVPMIEQAAVARQIEARILVAVSQLGWREIDAGQTESRLRARLFLLLSMAAVAVIRIALNRPADVSREELIAELADMVHAQLKDGGIRLSKPVVR